MVSFSLTANTTSSWFVWDDLHSQKYSMPGHGVHERSLVWVMPLFTSAGVQPIIGMTLQHFQTDALGIVPSQLVISPLGWNGTAYVELDNLFERDLMHYDVLRAQTSSSGAQTVWDMTRRYDIRAKRKVQDTDAILISFAANSPCTLTFMVRTYMSW